MVIMENPWTKEQIKELLTKYPSQNLTGYFTSSNDPNIHLHVDVYKDYVISNLEGYEQYHVLRGNKYISHDQFMKMIELKAFW